jgi:hypothetical protein
MYLTKLKKKKLKLNFSIKKRQCCKRTLTTHFRFGETYSLALSTCVWHRVHSAWSVPGPSPEPCFCLLHLPFCFIKKQIPFQQNLHISAKRNYWLHLLLTPIRSLQTLHPILRGLERWVGGGSAITSLTYWMPSNCTVSFLTWIGRKPMERTIYAHILKLTTHESCIVTTTIWWIFQSLAFFACLGRMKLWEHLRWLLYINRCLQTLCESRLCVVLLFTRAVSGVPAEFSVYTCTIKMWRTSGGNIWAWVRVWNLWLRVL